ncbi:MAG: SPASM domain-containing protein [Candidatus Gastranaerophilales bacterium]|nr:SPASM domain-containing protein [Candidatus Gastranaerophilales bacterium]
MNKEIRSEIIKNSKICLRPFEYFTVEQNGDVFCCCPAYTNQYILGNVLEQSFDEIWNGKKWKKFRKNIYENKYSKCNLDMCYGMEQWCFVDKNQIKQAKYPKYASLCIDNACNIICLFCRDKIKYAYPYFTKNNLRLNKYKYQFFSLLKKLHLYNKNNYLINTERIGGTLLKELIDEAEFIEKHIKKIDNFYIPMLREAKILMLNGAGEVFVSEFCKKLLKKTTVKYPNLKYQILTNGLLCDEEHLKKLNLADKLDIVIVSLHAATEQTYNKIIIGSDFNRVIENVKYLAKLKKENKINDVLVSFVISSLNYKDLPEFVEMAYSIGVNPVMWEVRDINDCRFCKEIEKYNICSKNHPEHEKLLEVLQNPVFKKYNIITNNLVSESD